MENQTHYPYIRCDPGNGGLAWQYINSDFTVAQNQLPIRDLLRGLQAYMRVPFAEYRSGELYLYYADKSGFDGNRIRQARANSSEDPPEGFKDVGMAIDYWDIAARSNHASVVTSRGAPGRFLIETRRLRVEV